MRTTILVCVATMVLVGVVCAGEAEAKAQVNLRPIIGILTEPTGSETSKFGEQYIAASYVKWIESAGARVVPVHYDLDNTELIGLVEQLNGFVVPGGGVELAHSQFLSTAAAVVNYAYNQYGEGKTFPVWGTCLGFQTLSVILANNVSVLENGFDSENLTLALDLTSAASQSRLLGTAPKEVVEILSSQPVTMNNHQAGVTPEMWQSSRLQGVATVLSTNKDRQGRAFVSTMEAVGAPIFGTQWHPEKTIFEWWDEEVMNHSYDSIVANSWTSRFFVNMARLNMNTFTSKDAEAKALIYNYAPVYTESVEHSFEQAYFFSNSSSSSE